MSRTDVSLEEQILQAFKRAYLEERFDVAEHLLRALEVLQSDPLFGAELGEAYLSVCPRPPGSEPLEAASMGTRASCW